MMTRDAKSALSKTIRALRERLLSDLHDAVQSRYRLGVARLQDADLAPHVAADRNRLDLSKGRMRHGIETTFALLALLLSTGCAPEASDRCSGDDPHPECDNNVPGDMNNMPGDAGDVGANNDVPDADMSMPPDLGPCGQDCSATDTFCEPTSGTCVSCLTDDHCGEEVCTDDNRCVECVETADCDNGVCATTTNRCVACLTNDECTDPTASLCDTASNTCLSCSGSADCSHLTDTSVCDTSGAEGVCVECLDDDDTTRAACMGNSCDPATNTCTMTPTESLGVCETCVADSECPAMHGCVPMFFDGNARGSYCLRIDDGNCQRPYTVPIAARASLSADMPRDFCGLAEDFVTCESVVSLRSDQTCPGGMDSECGAGLGDGICVGGDCSYACGDNEQCPIGNNCDMTNSWCIP